MFKNLFKPKFFKKEKSKITEITFNQVLKDTQKIIKKQNKKDKKGSK